ncbi:hypothetical protein CFC21_075976 [Triticum aestivum]|uniref:BTB domain-containing protein n=2 Tax=Triticum aestivum TaxID=4565 RepID=A0A9R1HRW3_WHEAT|nr:BTB/POZ and MATH domain-containing protein 2-like [Triticum aestivum]KAF7070455.1 hypothetical protein CFC21_075976 [Triticum aestivum]
MAAGQAALSHQHPVAVHQSIPNTTLRASRTTVQHVLKIQGYSWMSKSFDTGKGLRSKSFYVGGTTGWHIAFYPNGNRVETDDSVSVFAVLDDAAAGRAVEAEIGFDVLDPTTGEPMPRYRRPGAGVIRRFACIGAFCGYENFIRLEELEEFLLKDDCFWVRCNITVVEFLRETAPPPRPVVAAIPPPDWAQHFGDLLRSKQGANVMLDVGGETFAAHRCVLAARSPVFEAELYGAMEERNAYVRIDDMRAEVFRNLLHFAYTDELPPETIEDGAAMAQDLLKAADRYDMERLKLVCEDKLWTHIDASTAATTLLLAEQHGCHRLREACFEFLLTSSTTLNAVMATDGFGHLCKSNPGLLKDILSKLATHQDRRRRIQQWEEDDNHGLVLRTTEGDKLPEPTHHMHLGCSRSIETHTSSSETPDRRTPIHPDLTRDIATIISWSSKN